MIHVFIFRHIPLGGEVERWVAEYCPGAALDYGGGLRVVVTDDALGFYFKLAWAGHYSTHHQFLFHPDQGADPHAF